MEQNRVVDNVQLILPIISMYLFQNFHMLQRKTKFLCWRRL